MKKWLSVVLVACLCCGLLAGCGSKAEGNQIEKVENEGTKKTVSIQGYSFEIPESWEEGENTKDLLYYYPENAMLMVGYSEMNQSILDEQARKEFIDSFGSGMDDFTLISESEQDVAGQKAYRHEMNISMADEDWTATMVTYDCAGGVISFLMSTLVNVEQNYDKEFENILTSIKLESGAASEGKKQESGTDAVSVEKDIDVKAVPTMDGLICVFITNNSDSVIGELDVQLNYKNAEGTTIDTDADGHDTVLPGSTVVSRMETPDSYEDYEIQTNIEVDAHPKYENHAENVTVNSNQGDKCIIVEITNNSNITIEEIEYIAVLYQGDNIVTVEYPQDVYDVESGQMITEKINTYNDEYDRFEIYLNQAHTFGL